MYKSKIILYFVFCLLLTNCSLAQKQTSGKPASQNSSVNIREVIRKQVLLTNLASFTNDRTLEGASGFLIKHNGANFAVTARHLIGADGGVEPEIQIGDLEKSLIKWEMMPRVVSDAAKQTVKLDVKNLDFSQSKSDIILLKIISKDFEIDPLSPNFDLPETGERLYLIGCPYSETKCRQNFYEVKYVEFDDSENVLIGEINSSENLSGFSGAPLVNAKGEVVGVLVGGGEMDGKNYVTATRIKEIQKIKF